MNLWRKTLSYDEVKEYIHENIDPLDYDTFEDYLSTIQEAFINSSNPDILLEQQVQDFINDEWSNRPMIPEEPIIPLFERVPEPMIKETIIDRVIGFFRKLFR